MTSFQGFDNLPMVARLLILLVVILVVAGVAWLVVRSMIGRSRLGAATVRGRQQRLGVLDAHAVDARRKLVLVRRDNVEHLIMIGGPNDIVIESGIGRPRPAALRPGAATGAPIAGTAETPTPIGRPTRSGRESDVSARLEEALRHGQEPVREAARDIAVPAEAPESEPAPARGGAAVPAADDLEAALFAARLGTPEPLGSGEIAAEPLPANSTPEIVVTPAPAEPSPPAARSEAPRVEPTPRAAPIPYEPVRSEGRPARAATTEFRLSDPRSYERPAPEPRMTERRTPEPRLSGSRPSDPVAPETRSPEAQQVPEARPAGLRPAMPRANLPSFGEALAQAGARPPAAPASPAAQPAPAASPRAEEPRSPLSRPLVSAPAAAPAEDATPTPARPARSIPLFTPRHRAEAGESRPAPEPEAKAPPARPEPSRQEPSRQEPSRPEPSRQESSRQEPPRPAPQPGSPSDDPFASLEEEMASLLGRSPSGPR